MWSKLKKINMFPTPFNIVMLQWCMWTAEDCAPTTTTIILRPLSLHYNPRKLSLTSDQPIYTTLAKMLLFHSFLTLHSMRLMCVSLMMHHFVSFHIVPSITNDNALVFFQSTFFSLFFSICFLFLVDFHMTPHKNAWFGDRNLLHWFPYQKLAFFFFWKKKFGKAKIISYLEIGTEHITLIIIYVNVCKPSIKWKLVAKINIKLEFILWRVDFFVLKKLQYITNRSYITLLKKSYIALKNIYISLCDLKTL